MHHGLILLLAMPFSVMSAPTIEAAAQLEAAKKEQEEVAMKAFKVADCGLWIKAFGKAVAQYETDFDWLIEPSSYKKFSDEYYIIDGGGMKFQNGYGAWANTNWTCKVQKRDPLAHL
jgi:hypothetical protein